MSWQVPVYRAVDVFNKYTKTSKPQKTHYCGSKQKQTEKGLLQAKDRKKTELKDFQFYTLLPGYVSLLPHVAGCWRLLHQLLGPRDHRGLESAVLRPGHRSHWPGLWRTQAAVTGTGDRLVSGSSYRHFSPRFSVGNKLQPPFACLMIIAQQSSTLDPFSVL